MVTISFLSFSFAGKLKACLTCVTTSVVFPDALPSNFSKAFTTKAVYFLLPVDPSYSITRSLPFSFDPCKISIYGFFS